MRWHVRPATAVDKLEAARLLTRQANPASRREVIVRLNEEGQRLVNQVLARRHAEITAIVSRLADEQRVNLVEALRALVEAAGEPTARHAMPSGPEPATFP